MTQAILQTVYKSEDYTICGCPENVCRESLDVLYLICTIACTIVLKQISNQLKLGQELVEFSVTKHDQHQAVHGKLIAIRWYRMGW